MLILQQLVVQAEVQDRRQHLVQETGLPTLAVRLSSYDAFAQRCAVVQRGPECALHPLEFGGGEDLEGIGLGHSSGLHNHELGIAGVSLGHQELEGPLEPVSPALILYCQDLFLDVQGRPGDAKRTSPLAVPVYHALVISAMDVKRV